ncbi:MAG TPA: hypothetical protein VF519_00355 [Mycobacteriales bacterium]
MTNDFRRAARAIPGAAIAAAVALLPVLPARAVPPLTVTGTGYVAPGFYATPTPLWPNAVGFSGTATDPLGTTYGCRIEGSGVNYSPGQITGFAEVTCGPVTGTACPFTLSLTSWSIACTTTAGTFAVSVGNPNPVTSFTATGTLL